MSTGSQGTKRPPAAFAESTHMPGSRRGTKCPRLAGHKTSLSPDRRLDRRGSSGEAERQSDVASDRLVTGFISYRERWPIHSATCRCHSPLEAAQAGDRRPAAEQLPLDYGEPRKLVAARMRAGRLAAPSSRRHPSTRPTCGWMAREIVGGARAATSSPPGPCAASWLTPPDARRPRSGAVAVP